MTHEEFNSLYNNGKISLKIYSGTINENGNQVEKSIEAFEHDGKFYLRIHSSFDYILDRTAECGKRYKMRKENHFIKEFNNKNHANNYFKKIANGLQRII